jgi:isorenieratene synthase
MPAFQVGVVLVLVCLGLAFMVPRLLRAVIRKRLGDYRYIFQAEDASLPESIDSEVRIAVIGAGVAGLTSALTLSRRGYKVTLIEKNGYLGGKLGSWPVDLTPTRRVWVSHGFHAFFAHYHNLNRFLDSLGARNNFKSIGDYVILAGDGTELRFANLERTPVLNLISMWKNGAFTLGDALGSPGRDCYGVFLEYDKEKTFEDFDKLSFAEFARRTKLPRRLKLAFNTFARAFFADEEKLSFAELIKSFHFYFLSHDGGLVYDFPVEDYEPWLLEPLRNELQRRGAKVHTGRDIESLRHENGKFTIDDESFDRVIVACDVVGSRKLLRNAAGLPPETHATYDKLCPGQRYAVLRIWTDKDLRSDLPVFVITERKLVLDSVTALHRFEQTTQKDLENHPGFVLELHCYSVPDNLSDQDVKANLLGELEDFFPELRGLKVEHEHFQLRQDFTAFHVGKHAERPTTETGVDGLYVAGDWVKLPFPAMLLEAACASGLVAANHILKLDGRRPEPILSVPERGLMAGLASPPGRKVLFD